MKNSKKSLAKSLFVIALISISLGFKLKKDTQYPVNKINFSGVWKLNPTKSKFGKVPITAVYETMEIIQTVDSISIMKVGDPKSKQVIPLNGAQSVLKSAQNNRLKTSSIKWTAEGMVQNGSFSYTIPQKKLHQLKFTDLYKLSADGKTLIMERTMEISDPSYNWSIITNYDKI